MLKVKNEDDCYGFVNLKGEEAVPCKYDEVDIGFNFLEQINEGLISVRKNGCWGYVDYQGQTVIPLKYTYADMFNQGLAVVRDTNYKYGLIDKEGNAVAPCIYDDIERFDNGLAKVEKDGRFGALDKNGRECVPIIYDKINNFENGTAFAEKDGLWGVINEKGETVVPFKYDYDRVENTKNGFALAGYEDEAKIAALLPKKETNCWKKESRWYYLDADGSWYYLDTDGEMKHDTTVDGYKLGGDGAWIR